MFNLPRVTNKNMTHEAYQKQKSVNAMSSTVSQIAPFQKLALKPQYIIVL